MVAVVVIHALAVVMETALAIVTDVQAVAIHPAVHTCKIINSAKDVKKTCCFYCYPRLPIKM